MARIGMRNAQLVLENWKFLKGKRVKVRMKRGEPLVGEATDWEDYWDKNAAADPEWRSSHLALRQGRTTVALEIAKVDGWDPITD